jgi:ribonuclease T2
VVAGPRTARTAALRGDARARAGASATSPAPSLHPPPHAGLWPQNWDGSYPCYCSGPLYNGTLLDPIRATLDTVWPNFDCQQALDPACNGAVLPACNDGFWCHEYEKHGTCASTVMGDELSFFSGVPKLLAQYDILSAWATAGIKPGSTSYEVSKLAGALQTAYGTVPVVQCSDGKVTSVLSCWTSDLTLTDCPDNLGGCTSSYISLPAPPSKGASSAAAVVA